MITKSQVKYIQSLGQKKFRDEEAVFIAEGPKIINELLGGLPGAVIVIYATRNWIEDHFALLKNIPSSKLNEIKEAELERLSFLPAPNQVLGLFQKPAAPPPGDFNNSISLMLDGIQDPGNMGTIIRIADWFGIDRVICSTDCADAFAPKVVQSSMGSIARIQLLYTDLLQFVKENAGLALYAASLNGKRINEMEKLKKGVIVIGNESKGIRKDLLDLCAERITIPRLGHAESLNAAVATGILLSHLLPLPASRS
jgi:RNA methyltransferase, TrmH family